MKEFVLKHKKIFFIMMIIVGVYLLYFHNIWMYKLLDVDETRYVNMSSTMFHDKEFMTLYLNGKFFFEKPPLYFWIENLFFGLFGGVSEGVARIPIGLQSLFAALAVYFAGAKVVSKKFGLIVACILGTSLEFIVMSKIAILDMLLTSCITISVFSGFMTYFVQEQNKKYFWWLFYIFSGLAVMAKGIPGFVVPFGVMFFVGLYAKNLKEFFKPKYFGLGTLLFLLIVLPWHIAMLHIYGKLFFDEYIIKHHLLRFIGSDVIHRERPFLFYIPILAWGFFPWVFSFVSMFVEKCRGFRYRAYETLENKDRFVALSIIGALFTMLFFSVSGTKLVTYILPVYPFLAVILANYWCEDGCSKIFKIFSQVLNSILILVGFEILIAKSYLPLDLYNTVSELKFVGMSLCIVAGGLGVVFAKDGKKLKLFTVYTVLMVLLSAFGTHHFFNINAKFGQNDLIEYAQIAKAQNKKIVGYKTGKKYSLIYYSGAKKVLFLGEDDEYLVPQYLNNKSNLVIIKNKDFKKLKFKYTVVKKGVKYSIVTSASL